jgi:hypothetical protein
MFNPPQDSLKEREVDERDMQLGAIIKWPSLLEIPEEYRIEPLSIKNQNADGKDDACASCAITGMIEPKEEAILYYPFVFAAAKHEAGGDPNSWGLTLKDVGKALTKHGAPEATPGMAEIADWRNYAAYPQYVRDNALKHRAQTYFFIEGYPSIWDPYTAAKAALWYFRDKKQQFMFGVRFAWSVTDKVLDGIPEGGFGHAMWCCGWNKDGLIVVQSVGREAGENGMHIITRKTFNFYAKKYGMMMITDLPREKAEYMISNNIRLTDNWLIALLKSLGLWKQKYS